MYRVEWILFLCCVTLPNITQCQRSFNALSYPRERRPFTPHHPYKSPPPPTAEDRRFHWIKHLKRQKKHNLRHLKKHFKKCGLSHPYKLKIFRRSGDGEFDTIHVVVPYGYGTEYFPRPQAEEKGRNKTVPTQYHTVPKTQKSGNIYSVKFRNEATALPMYQQYHEHSWEPSDFNNAFYDDVSEVFHKNGTADGVSEGNSRRYDVMDIG